MKGIQQTLETSFTSSASRTMDIVLYNYSVMERNAFNHYFSTLSRKLMIFRTTKLLLHQDSMFILYTWMYYALHVTVSLNPITVKP